LLLSATKTEPKRKRNHEHGIACAAAPLDIA
jgi:hypothetical protein